MRSLTFLCSSLHYFLRPSPVVVTDQIRNYAARKGYREAKKKAKVKVEVQKKVWMPGLKNKEKYLANRKNRKVEDFWKGDPIDDVFPMRFYKWIVYPFVEAVNCHRETHHPDMYSMPNARVQIAIELNMEAEKKDKYIDNFSGVVAIPHTFDHGEERSILAFTKDVDVQKEIREAGAALVGGIELIKEVQNGAISLQDFQYIIAHPNILPELVSLRGLMKRKFPAPKLGTLDIDIPSTVRKFLHGINYTAIKDEYEKDFAIIESTLGTLDMEPMHLEENFACLIRDVWMKKPKYKSDFIRRCILTSPPSREQLKINHEVYLNQEVKEEEDENEEEEQGSLSVKA